MNQNTALSNGDEDSNLYREDGETEGTRFREGDSEENTNKKYDNTDSNELFVSLQKSKDNEDEYNEKIGTLLRRVGSGHTSLQGELEEIKQGEGTEVQLAAAIIARDREGERTADSNDKADAQGKNDDVERSIESYAKSHGAWESKDDIVKNSDGEEMLAEGGENNLLSPQQKHSFF